MYIFYDEYSRECQLLEKTLQAIHAEYKIIVQKEDFFLPEKAVSLYEHVVQKQDTDVYTEKAVDYGFVEVPQFWQIRAEDGVGNIYNMGHKKGIIYSGERNNQRMVRRIEWLSKDGNIYKTDYYNKYGFVCCRSWKDASGKETLKTYYTSKGEEVISCDLMRRNVSVFESGVVKQNYSSQEDLRKAVLEELVNKGETILTNSLSVVKQIQEQDVTGTAKVVVILNNQEDVLKYRESCPDGRRYPLFIVNSLQTSVMDTESQKQEYKLSFVGEGREGCRNNKHALVVTTTDQLLGIEELIGNIPEITFDIAANTLVSEKIMNLQKYPNVKVYECIEEMQVRELLENASFYLDINYARELYNVVTEASVAGVLILGQKSCMHNPRYVLEEYYFEESELARMIVEMRALTKDNEKYRMLLEKQKRNAWNTVKALAELLGIKEESYGYLCI